MVLFTKFSTKVSTGHPIQFYAATKRSNELMGHSYSYINNLPITFNVDSTILKILDTLDKNIKDSLEDWCKTISPEYNSLHYSCAERLNIGRICFINDFIKL